MTVLSIFVQQKYFFDSNLTGADRGLSHVDSLFTNEEPEKGWLMT